MAYVTNCPTEVQEGIEKVQCDNCGEWSYDYCRSVSKRLSGTLCAKCFSLIPENYFSESWNGEGSEEFLMMLLKLK